MSKNLLLYLIAAFIIGVIISNIFFKSEKVITKTVVDTTYVDNQITGDMILPDYETKVATPDTVYKFINKDNLKDTLKTDTVYVAKLDSTFTTDKKDTIKIYVEYVSPVPLSHYSYFNLKIHFHSTEIHQTDYVEVKPGFNLFGLHLQVKQGPQVSVGYGLINQKFDFFVGYGITLLL